MTSRVTLVVSVRRILVRGRWLLVDRTLALEHIYTRLAEKNSHPLQRVLQTNVLEYTKHHRVGFTIINSNNSNNSEFI